MAQEQSPRGGGAAMMTTLAHRCGARSVAKKLTEETDDLLDFKSTTSRGERRDLASPRIRPCGRIVTWLPLRPPVH